MGVHAQGDKAGLTLGVTWPERAQTEDRGHLVSEASAVLSPDTLHQRWASEHLGLREGGHLTSL